MRENGKDLRGQLFLKIMDWISEERSVLIKIYDAACSDDLDRRSILSKVSELGNVQAAITNIFLEDKNNG